MRARKELQRLSQIEICIPADLEVYCEGRSVDTLTDGHIGAIKQIIYYDSTGCSSCQINHLAMTESLSRRIRPAGLRPSFFSLLAEDNTIMS